MLSLVWKTQTFVLQDHRFDSFGMCFAVRENSLGDPKKDRRPQFENHCTKGIMPFLIFFVHYTSARHLPVNVKFVTGRYTFPGEMLWNMFVTSCDEIIPVYRKYYKFSFATVTLQIYHQLTANI